MAKKLDNSELENVSGGSSCNDKEEYYICPNEKCKKEFPRNKANCFNGRKRCPYCGYPLSKEDLRTRE